MRIIVQKNNRIHMVGYTMVDRHAGNVMNMRPGPEISSSLMSKLYFLHKYPRYPKIIKDASTPVKLLISGILRLVNKLQSSGHYYFVSRLSEAREYNHN